jgi:hypothetical protein
MTQSKLIDQLTAERWGKHQKFKAVSLFVNLNCLAFKKIILAFPKTELKTWLKGRRKGRNAKKIKTKY